MSAEIKFYINLDIQEIPLLRSLYDKYTKNNITSIPVLDVYEGQNKYTNNMLFIVGWEEEHGIKFYKGLRYDKNEIFWGNYTDEDIDDMINNGFIRKLSENEWIKYCLIRTDMPYVPVS